VPCPNWQSKSPLKTFFQYVFIAWHQPRSLIFFVVAPCVLIHVEFTHQQMSFFILKNTLKFTLKYTSISQHAATQPHNK